MSGATTTISRGTRSVIRSLPLATGPVITRFEVEPALGREEAREDAYVAKYYADEMAFKAADQCMQIHGGIALTTDLPIEKMWRQQRSYRITEGASEVMKMVIARHVLKTYG